MKAFDNINIYKKEGTTILYIEYKFNIDLHILEIWWLLNFNPSKIIKAFIFQRKTTLIYPKKKFKVIGWSVSHNLSWSVYIDSSVDKAY